uniref:Structural protein n=1 Tax=Bursaphelenchus xylophilus TaxID=6326 RepID=A0A1I7SMB9_BURXY
MSNNSSLCSGESGLSGVYSEYDRQFSAEDEKKVRRSVSQAVRIYLRASQASARLKIKVDFANAEAIRHSMVIYRPPIVEFQLDQVELNSAVTDKNNSNATLKYVNSMTTIDDEYSISSEAAGPVGSISEDLLNGKPQKRVQVGGGLLDLIK